MLTPHKPPYMACHKTSTPLWAQRSVPIVEVTARDAVIPIIGGGGRRVHLAQLCRLRLLTTRRGE